MTIPTFNNGDLMEEVRTKSLNPFISKANAIETLVQGLQTGQRVGGRAKSNKADGAYVQSVNPSEYIVQTIVEFDELKVNP